MWKIKEIVKYYARIKEIIQEIFLKTQKKHNISGWKIIRGFTNRIQPGRTRATLDSDPNSARSTFLTAPGTRPGFQASTIHTRSYSQMTPSLDRAWRIPLLDPARETPGWIRRERLFGWTQREGLSAGSGHGGFSSSRPKGAALFSLHQYFISIRKLFIFKSTNNILI